MFKYIKGLQRQLKIKGICVRDRKVLGILRQMSGAEHISGIFYYLAMGHEDMGKQAPEPHWSLSSLSVMAVTLLTEMSVYL